MKLKIATFLLLLTGIFSLAHAATIGFTFTLAGNTNIPTMTFINDADTLNITSVSFSVGDLTRHFDLDNGSLPTSQNGITGVYGATTGRVDVISVTTTGFNPGNSFGFSADVDVDPAQNVGQDYRNIFFNNGAAANSVASVTFSDNSTLQIVLTDEPNNLASYSFSTQDNTTVPEPSTYLLSLLAFAVMFCKRQK